MEYFEQAFRLDGEQRWLIHYSNDEDGVVVDKERRVLVFGSLDAVREYAKKKRIKPGPAKRDLDFDGMESWLKRPQGELDCPSMYYAWNLLGDVSNSVGEGLHYPGYQRPYQYLQEELLWGCNLPGPWNSHQPYIPDFHESDLAMLADVLLGGLQVLRERQRAWDGSPSAS